MTVGGMDGVTVGEGLIAAAAAAKGVTGWLPPWRDHQRPPPMAMTAQPTNHKPRATIHNRRRLLEGEAETEWAAPQWGQKRISIALICWQ
ncbi:MAG: hypothetical protein Fur0044_07180 [Anaerolineae bacterium]